MLERGMVMVVVMGVIMGPATGMVAMVEVFKII